MKNIIISASIASLAGLSGCTTFDAYTGEEKATNTTKGASIGAGTALVASYLANKDKSSSERKKRMLRDAGVGAVVGGGIGYFIIWTHRKLN